MQKVRLIFFVLCSLAVFSQAVRGDTAGENQIIPLVRYYVVAAGNTATFLKEYCEKTDVNYEILSDGEIKTGPFLSGYEAHWLSGLTMNARVVEDDPFSSEELPDSVAQQGCSGSKLKLFAGTRSAVSTPIYKHIIVKIKVPDFSEPFFYLSTKKCLFAIGHPYGDFYQESFGLAYVDSMASPLFIQIVNGGRGTGCKNEFYNIWYFDAERQTQIPLHEVKATDFFEHEDYIYFTVSRLSLHKSTLHVQYYDVTGSTKDVPQYHSLKVPTEHFSDVYLLRNFSIKKGKLEPCSLDPEEIDRRNLTYQRQMGVLPESVQAALEGKAPSSSISFPDLLSTINNYVLFINDHPETIKEFDFSCLIRDVCERYNCQNNLELRQALLDNIKNPQLSFILYTYLMDMIFKISKIPGGVINFPEINVAFRFYDTGGATFDGVYGWEEDGELIRNRSYEWWDAHWAIGVSEGERQRRINEFEKKNQLPIIDYSIDAEKGTVCGLRLNQTYAEFQEIFAYRVKTKSWKSHECDSEEEIGFIVVPLRGLEMYFDRNNMLIKIETSSPELRTVEGIGCGNTKDELIATYGTPDEIFTHDRYEEYVYKFKGFTLAFTFLGETGERTIINYISASKEYDR